MNMGDQAARFSSNAPAILSEALAALTQLYLTDSTVVMLFLLKIALFRCHIILPNVITQLTMINLESQIGSPATICKDC